MMIIFRYLTLFALFMAAACTQRITTDDDGGFTPVVEPYGDSTTFEIATWNMEYFPMQGAATINAYKDIIRSLNIDMYGVQEVADVDGFNTLLDSLEGWRGVLSDDVYSDGSYQKTGLLYNSRYITVSGAHTIFNGDYKPFPRPPLYAYAEVRDSRGLQYNFNVIVLHLKAFSGESNEARRREACDKLAAFIESEIDAGADPDFIVLGDWNDQLNDPPASNVFTAFTKKPQLFRFLTSGLTQGSYVSSNSSLIDHILITSDSESEYDGGTTEVRYLDNDIANYTGIVSDHRPVIARFKGFDILLK
ncbi:MAG: hypothetical protein D6677_02240 [Calditrichaeota bacterium]|nr:MAG: hypothetical protein D6677_02240 [Calditrichota bacterium]